MKKSLLIILATFSVTAFAGGEIQKVCHEKNGKQVCKNVKVHKAIADATAVPVKKK